LVLALSLGLACTRDEAADDASYDDRVAAEHAGDRPVPGAAAEATGDIEVSSREVAYATVDGREVTGYLAYPAGAELRTDDGLPGLVVIHEWWGLNEHIVHWTDRLAAEGYAALAVDLYLGQVAQDRDRAMALVGAVDDDVALDTLRRAHRFLTDDPRVRAPRTGSIGWCFGGGWSLRLALGEPEMDACVVYYGKLVTDPVELAPLGAEVFGVFGSRDGSIPPDVVADFAEALKTAGKPHTIRVFEADHAFANPSSQRYDEDAATAAWAEVRAFLAETLRR
jgi:carboxymethylenebutenolidase